jgi:hypothetical protein
LTWAPISTAISAAESVALLTNSETTIGVRATLEAEFTRQPKVTANTDTAAQAAKAKAVIACWNAAR